MIDNIHPTSTKRCLPGDCEKLNHGGLHPPSSDTAFYVKHTNASVEVCNLRHSKGVYSLGKICNINTPQNILTSADNCPRQLSLTGVHSVQRCHCSVGNEVNVYRLILFLYIIICTFFLNRASPSDLLLTKQSLIRWCAKEFPED